MRIATAFGVGHPSSVRKQVSSYGATLVTDVPLADHQHFDVTILEKLHTACQGADGLLVTAKDWVKLRHMVDFTSFPVPILVPELRIDFLRGGEFLEARVVETIRSSGA